MEYNPYELIYMSRSGDSFPMQTLFSQYQAFFSYIKDSITKRNLSYRCFDQDMYMEMRLGLLESIDRYREDQNASWLTFLSLVSKRKCINLVRQANVSGWVDHTMSLEAMVKDEGSIYEVIEQRDALANPEYSLKFKEAKAQLHHTIKGMNDEELEYVYLWTKDATCTEGCTYLNCEEREWYRKMSKVKSKVRSSLK